MPTDVIFDTDAGSDIDDLYALALVVRHPELSLKGVTTVGGDTQSRARLLAKMLRLAGLTDVPVHAGIAIPGTYGQDDIDLVSMRSSLTHYDLVRPDDPENEQSFGDAIQFMLDALERAEKPITIIGTGAWSNIAEVIARADERQKAMIGCLSLMGGELHIMHNECNVKNDPEAAALILSSGIPTFLATWSISRQLNFPMPEVHEFFGHCTDPFNQALYEGSTLWWKGGKDDKPGPVCYDVIPVFWAAGERDAIQCIRVDQIPVELEGKYTRGMTISYPWKMMRPEPTDQTSTEYLTATHAIDAALLKRQYLDLVLAVEATE
jgi:inosine-uridine nucleoside N-ribohydrolase